VKGENAPLFAYFPVYEILTKTPVDYNISKQGMVSHITEPSPIKSKSGPGYYG